MILAQAQAPQLPDLPEGPSLDRVRGAIEIPAYEPWQIALAVLCGLFFLGLIFWAFLRRRKKSATPCPPYETALAELKAAAEFADDERFAVLTSTALRRYFENGLGLRFKARTSEEFLRSLKGNSRLDSAYQAQLGEVLAAFDQIKFARSTVAAEDRVRLSQTVRDLIDQAHSKVNREVTQA